MIDLSGVGNKIEVARKRKNLSQTKLAEMIGVTRASISLYETGTGRPSNKVLHKLADALEVTFGYLTDLGEDIPQPSGTLLKLERMNGYRCGLIEKLLGRKDEYREVQFYGSPLYLAYLGIRDLDVEVPESGTEYPEWPSIPVLRVEGVDYSLACVSIIEDKAMKPRYPEKSRHVFLPVIDRERWEYLTGLYGFTIDGNPIIVRRIIANKETTMVLADAEGNEMDLKKKNVSMIWRVGQTVHMPLEE